MKSQRKSLILLAALFLATVGSCRGQEVSGDYYDWQRTMTPERPWIHDYSQTLVMKLHLCDRDAEGKVAKVSLTFSDALDVIKRLDNITLGIPKIVYLTGWQFNGHDSKYPAWNEVNDRLKRQEDKDALQSLRWLMVEARRYHTIVSLHINMIDAYEDSPLWEAYDRNNIVLKDVNGQPIEGEKFDGMQSYQISYAQEWRTGFAQKRIDELLEMLPELKEAGTIHIDAFHSVQPARPVTQPARADEDQLSSPFLGLTIQDELDAQRKIIRYWRTKGLDVTTEYGVGALKPDPFIGLVPMVWWYNIDEFWTFDWFHKPTDYVGLPPRLYIGTPMHAEDEIMHDPNHLEPLVQQFCEKVVPWYYVNNVDRKEAGFLWTPGGDGVFAPALWLPETVVACAPEGVGNDYQSNRYWRLPKSWGQTSNVKLMRITDKGLIPEGVLPVEGHTVKLALKSGVVYAIQR